ncbi:MAG: NADH-quinone oxidoreductase subunit C [Proteobacteria bacterium]|nr:NADH-quinone oxidoreductase subunit C [Pseudomonadota bacterium]
MRLPLSQLKNALIAIFGEGVDIIEAYRELALEVPMAQLSATMQRLRDDANLLFDALTDVAGVDYEGFTGREPGAPRFAVVYHLLSTKHNWRLRVRAFVESEIVPTAPSMAPLWPSANWMERECFDLFGIAFDGHPDLRRILTDYGFTGHPFRKDFPLSGNIEMRYDPEQKKVVYEPVTVEPRDNVPRIVREPHYGDGAPMPIPPAETPR